MAAYDPRYSAAGNSPFGVSQESLYADYLRDMFESAASQYDGYTAQPQYRVNYADPQSGLAPGFRRPSDLFQLDPDPFGTQTASIGAGLPTSGVSGDSVLALDVFGKRMTREQLQQSDSGRRLLEISERARTGRRRGFLEAITDWSWSDAPFLSLFATVGKSVSDAVTVSDTFRKLQNGEPVTDDELVKTRLYMAEQEERQNGTWGATVGDIMRAAPGFMVEFLASGGVFSAARTGLAKALGASGIHLAMNRMEKTAAREAVEIAASKTISAKGFSSGLTGWRSWFVDGAAYGKLAADDAAKSAVASDATTTLLRVMKQTQNVVTKDLSDDALLDLAKRRVSYEMDKMFARNASEHMMVRGLHGFAQWAGRHASSGLLDLGGWGTEEATVLTTGFTKARSAIADAIGAFGPEAVIRGSLLMLPNQLVAKPLAGLALGQDGRIVSEAQLSLQQAAYLKGLKDPEAGKRLMDAAGSYAAGMNWLEYVSENAGRGFGSLMRGVGLFWDRTVKKGVQGLARPAAQAALAGAVDTPVNEGFRVGTLLRKWWKESIGSREDVVRRTVEEKANVVSAALQKAGVTPDRRALVGALRTNSVDGLSAEVKAAIGPDFGKFVKTAMDESGKFRMFGRLWLGDFMTRHNIGPESMLNMWQRMGYDGTLGEMFEERYCDVAKALFGWDDKDNDTVFARVKEGIRSLWPGWEQLTAEAVGFSVPGVSRMLAARLQAKIGGAGRLAEMRDKLSMFSDMTRDPITWRGTVGESFAYYNQRREDLAGLIRDAWKEESEARSRGDEAAARTAAEKADVAKRTYKRYVGEYTKWFGRRKALAEGADVEEAARLNGAALKSYVQEHESEEVTMAPALASTVESEGKAHEMRTVSDSARASKAMDAYEQFIEYAPTLARIRAEIDAPMEGESPSFMRKVAGRIVGMANALLTGDFSLAFNDPATWVARDMGVGRQFLDGLARAYKAEYDAVADELRATKVERAGRRTQEPPSAIPEGVAVPAGEIEEPTAEEVDTAVEELNAHAGAEVRPPAPQTPAEQGQTFIVTDEEIAARTMERFAPTARKLARNYLASLHIRAFSRTEMRDQALLLFARRNGYDIYDIDGRTLAKALPDAKPAQRQEVTYTLDDLNRRYVEGQDQNDLVNDGWDPFGDEAANREWVLGKAEKDGMEVDRTAGTARKVEDVPGTGGIDETSRIGFDAFYGGNRDEIDRLTSQIATATLDILSAHLKGTEDDRARLQAIVSLPDTSDLGRHAVYEAAMRMSGMSETLEAITLDRQKPVGVTLSEESIANVSSHVIAAIAAQAMNPDGTWDESRVDQSLLESVAYAIGARFDGTLDSKTGLRARNRRIVEACVIANMIAQGKGDVAFLRIYSDPRDEDSMRISDGPYSFVRVNWRDGKWTFDSKFVGSSEADGTKLTADTLEELVEKVKGLPGAFNVDIADGKVLFTQARVLETTDMFTMLRATGLLGEYIRMTSDGPTHPLLRKMKDGKTRTEIRNDGTTYESHWEMDEDTAYRMEREEADWASRWDGERLIRPTSDSLTPEALEQEAKRAQKAWEDRYGEDGYVTLAETLMRANNIDTSGFLDMIAGRQTQTPRYQVMLNAIVNPRTADIYVPVDVGRMPNLRSALVNARLQQAYAMNARLVWNTFGPSVSQFVNELDALAAMRISRAEEDGDVELVKGLRDFRRTVTSRVDRYVDDDKAPGGRRLLRGVGLTPAGFTAMAHAFCLYGDRKAMREGYASMPTLRAMYDLAPEARKLAHYDAFMSMVDLSLGGSGFLAERFRKEGERAATSRGLAGLLRAIHNSPEAMAETYRTGPGGVSYETLLAGCDRRLTALKRPPIPPAKRQRLQSLAKAAPYSLDAHDEFMDELGATVGYTGKPLMDFLQKSIDLARKLLHDAGFERQEGDPAGEELTNLEKIAERATVLENAKAAVPELQVRREEAAATVEDVQTKLTSLGEKLTGLEASIKATEDPDARASLEAQKAGVEADIAAAAETARALEKNLNGIEKQLADITDALANGGDSAEEIAVPADVPTEPEDYPGSATDGLGNGFYSVSLAQQETELPTVEDLTLRSGAEPGDLIYNMTDSDMLVSSNLTMKEARAATSIILRDIVAAGTDGAVKADDVEVGLSDVLGAIDRMFPAMPQEDRHLIVATFASAARDRGAKSWNAIAREGVDWTPLDEDKDENEGADTASEDRRVVRTTLNELDGEDLRTFLKLSQWNVMQAGDNLQAMLRDVRDEVDRAWERLSKKAKEVKEKGEKLSASDLQLQAAVGQMRALLNQRAAIEANGEKLDTANRREAMFALQLKTLKQSPALVNRHIKAFRAAGRRAEEFLLAYLMALPDGALERFAQLLSVASPADGISIDYRRGDVRAADRSMRRPPLAAATGSFMQFVGHESQELRALAAKLRRISTVTLPDLDSATRRAILDGKVSVASVTPESGALGLFPVDRNSEIDLTRNRNAVADALEPILGAESPIVMMLRSDNTFIIRRPDIRRRYAEQFKLIRESLAYSDVGFRDGKKVTGVQECQFVQLIADILDTIAGTTKRNITRKDVIKGVISVMSAGSPGKDAATVPYKSSRISSPLMAFFALYASRLPQTLLQAHVDRRKGGSHDRQVAITSPGTAPLITRWLDDPNGFRKAIEGFDAEIVQWGMDHGLDMVHGSEEDRKAAIEGLMAWCRQNMCWPDGTHIVAKNTSVSWNARQLRNLFDWDFSSRFMRGTDDKAYAPLARQDMSNRLKDAPVLVPLYAGDKSSSVVIQVPAAALSKAAQEFISAYRDHSKPAGQITPNTLDKAHADALEEAARAWNGAVEDASQRIDATGDLVENAKEFVRNRLYRIESNRIARSLGLALLGDDTKRASLSSLERPGTSMIGARVENDGKLTFGTCRVSVVYNFQSAQEYGDRGNEEGKGTVYAYGYGAERQRAAAKQQGTPTLKFHVMSTSGRFLSFFKALFLSIPETEGGMPTEMVADSYAQSLSKVASKGIRPDIDTGFAMDFDSYKIGPALSKWLRVVTTSGEKVDIIEYIVRRIQSQYADLANPDKVSGVKISQDDVNATLASMFTVAEGSDFAGFWEAERGDGLEAPKSIEDILPGLKVTVVDGFNGPTVAISYEDPGLTGYSVANVSHTARTRDARTPRNHVIDAMALSRTEQLLGDECASSRRAQEDVMNLVSDWGLAIATIYGRQETIASYVDGAAGAQSLRDRGEVADSATVKEELSRVAWARMRENLNVPMWCDDMPLLSSGVGVVVRRDKDGNIMFDNQGRPLIHVRSGSKMIRDLNYGPIVFTAEERELYHRKKRLGYAAINCTDRSFRYAWWMDDAKFDEKFLAGESDITDVRRMERLEEIITSIRNSDIPEGLSEEQLRMRLASCFKDHKGLYISSYGAERVNAILFDDLFDGNGSFDRSAVQINTGGYNDRVHLDADGEAHILLGGTRFGVPRTPSYNGAQWGQNVRASVPIYTVPLDRTTGAWRPGYHAGVALDPVTYEILGCDNDGDKTKTYMLYGRGGHVKGDGAIPEFEGNLDEFKAGPEGRKAYYDQLRAAGFVTEREDPKTGDIVRTVSPFARVAVANRFTQDLFDLNDAMLVPGDGTKRVSFLDGPMSRPTKAYPGSDAGKKERLKAGSKRKGSGRSIPEGSRLDDVELGADVEAKAADAADARARSVSIAKSLHLAWTTGWFADGVFQGVGARQWLQFIHCVDGLSNATFDDIKEQLCYRFGWTSGMLSCFVTDLILNLDETDGTYAGHSVMTDAEADRVIKQYVDEINSFGARYFMMMASDNYDEAGFSDALVSGGLLSSRSDFGGRRWAEFFSIRRGKDGWNLDGEVEETAQRSAGRAVAESIQRLHAAGRLPCSLSDALGCLAFGVSEGSRDNNAVPGWLLHLAMTASGAEATVRKDGTVDFKATVAGIVKNLMVTPAEMREKGREAALDQEVERFVRWSITNRELEEMRMVGESFNYMSADPGSQNVAKLRRTVLEKADAIRKRHQRDVATGFYHQHYEKMTAATQVAYHIGYGLETLASRGMTDVMLHDYNLEALLNSDDAANNDHLGAALSGAALLDPLRETGGNAAFDAEANVLTVRSVIAALQTTGNRGPLQNLALMQALAGAITDDEDGKKGVPKNLRSPVMRFRKVVETMFDLMSRLAGTSTEHYRTPLASRKDQTVPVWNPVFGLFGEMPTDRFESDDFRKDSRKAVQRGANRIAPSIYSIVPAFSGETKELNEILSELVEDLVSGKSFSKERVRSGRGEVSAKATEAKTFNLDAENLDAFLEEPGNSGDGEGARMLRDSVALVKAALESLAKSGILKTKEGEAVSITPKMLFTEILPLYFAVTARPTDEGQSALGLLPGVRHEWSRQSARNDRLFPQLMSFLGSVNSAPPIPVGDESLRSFVRSGEQIVPLPSDEDVPDIRTDWQQSGAALSEFIAMRKLDAEVQRQIKRLPDPDAGETADHYRNRLTSVLGNPFDKAPPADPDESAVSYRKRVEDSLPDMITARGTIVRGRGNMSGARMTDPFAGGGMLANAAQYMVDPFSVPKDSLAQGGVFENQAAADRSLTDLQRLPGEGEGDDAPDPETRHAALAARAMCPWMKVRFIGKTAFVLEGDIKESFETGAPRRAKALITVSMSDTVLPDASPEVLARSPAYAASLVAVNGAKLGLKDVGDFFRLPFEARVALAEKYGTNGLTGGDVLWTMDRKRMETLVGNIRLSGKAGTELYHEYFHQMVAMFRHLGVFSKADVEALRKTFGEPPPGTGMLFNEEVAAEAFRKFVISKTYKSAETASGSAEAREAREAGMKTVRNVFQKLFDFVSRILRSLVNGFSYNGRNTQDILFSLVLRGVAAMSTSRIEELTQTTAAQDRLAADGHAVADGLRTNVPSGTRVVVQLRRGRNEKDQVRLMKAGDTFGEPGEGQVKVRDASPREAQRYAEALLGKRVERMAEGIGGTVAEGRATAEEQQLVARLRNELDDAGSEVGMVKVAATLAELSRPTFFPGKTTFMDGFLQPGASREQQLKVLRGENVHRTAADFEGVRLAVGLGPSPVAAKTEPAYMAGRSVAEGLAAGLRENGTWAKDAESVLKTYASQAPQALSDIARDRAAIIAGLQDAASVLGARLDSETLRKNLVFQLAGSVAGRVGANFVRQALETPGSNAWLHERGASKRRSKAMKAHASAYDVSAWILASGGIAPGEPVRDAYDELQRLSDACTDSVAKGVVDRTLGLLKDVLKVTDDRTALLDELTGSTTVFDRVIPSLVAGLDYAGRDRNGRIRDYRLVNEGPETDEDAKAWGGSYTEDNIAAYRDALLNLDSPDYAKVQDALKIAIGATFRAKAALKFFRELGIQPASPADIAFAHQVEGMFAKSQSAEEWCREHAIGNSNLLDNEGLVEFYDQPFFTAEDMDTWLASHVRASFGGLDLREALSPGDFGGIMHELQDLENFLAFQMGQSSEPGSNLLAISVQDRKFKMDAGVVKRVNGFGRVLSVDNYHRDTCPVSLDLREHRMVDYYLKALFAKLRGCDRVITGVDRVRFSQDDLFALRDPGQLDYGFIKDQKYAHKQGRSDEARGAGKEAKAHWIQNELWRTTLQIPEGILETPPSEDGPVQPGFYDRYKEAVLEALAKVGGRLRALRRKRMASDPAKRELLEAQYRRDMERYEERRANLNDPITKPPSPPPAGDLTAAEADELANFDFNDRMLKELEAKGLVTCRYENGRRMEGVISMPVNDIISRFKGSSAYIKLTSEARWRGAEGYWGATDKAERDKQEARRRAEFEPEALIAPFRKAYGRLVRFVLEHPWITKGDARHLTRFGTPLPFFQGSGVFMANAVRMSREGVVRTKPERLAADEETFLQIIEHPDRANRRVSQDPNAVDMDSKIIDMAGRMLGLTDRGPALVKALIDGEYAPPEPGSTRTHPKADDLLERHGFTISKDPTYAELATAIYRIKVDEAWEAAMTRGAPSKEAQSAARLVDLYNERSALSGEIIGGVGVPDSQMYRNFGVLPANFQLGHGVRVAAEGVTNALMHRLTFMTMMLTPAADGAPVYYMRPDDGAAELSGIPDACWGQIARWWASFHGLEYDPRLTGVKNAQRLYDQLFEKVAANATGRKTYHLKAGLSDHRYIPLPDDHDLVSVSGIMCMDDEELGGESSTINALAKGEAVGYMKQFVGSGRGLGFLAVRKGWRKALSWSKSMSVAFSLFFPLATRFESPIGAVGFIPTLFGNFAPGMLREHADLLNGLMKIFPGSGWLTKDFMGSGDVLGMMDSRDPFMADLWWWADALGVTTSDRLVNPAEPTKSIVANDIATMKERVRHAFGWKAASRFARFADAVMLRGGDRAFNYMLNATKLAVVSQMALKLRYAAKRHGKAFDPIRDMRRYAAYINAELGGIDERRYAWAHPMMRGILNALFFSWQWTRGAWEAGGGNVIEDFVFGGHSSTREERKYLLGRWARMYGEIMIGLPMLMQAFALGLAKAMGGGDDDDRWFTWQNESKVGMSAFDITPLMKVLHRHEDVAGIAGRVAGAVVGARKFGALGAVGGLLLGDRLVPDYTGKDQANQTTRNRRYYMHFGKQGWEFFRWFDKPGQQFMGKLSMPAQRLLEGFFGRNLGYLERKLPWDGMGPAERWLNPTLDSATVNLVKAFLPFSVGQFMSFGDAGFLPIVGPVQMGASQTAIQKRLEEAVDAWARNDRTAYSWGVYRAPKKGKAKRLAGMFSDILADARRNGLDPEQQLNTALGTVARNYYGKLFSLLPDEPDGEYDVKAVERVCRALNRLLTRKASVLQSAEKKLEKQGRPLDKMDPAMRTRLRRIIGRHMADPFAGEMEPATEPPTREEY